MRFFFKSGLAVFLFWSIIYPQKLNIISSNNEFLQVEIDFSNAYSIEDTSINNQTYKYIRSGDFFYREEGTPYLPEYTFQVAVPGNSSPRLSSRGVEVVKLPNIPLIAYNLREEKKKEQVEFSAEYNNNINFPEQPVKFQKDFVLRYSRIFPVTVSPYQYNPVTRELTFNKKVEVYINYNASPFEMSLPVNDDFTKEYLKNNVVNKDQAYSWVSRTINTSSPAMDYWYNPGSDYYKIYVSQKGLYRVTYQDLINSGAQLNNPDIARLQLFNEGHPVPIDIHDDGDQVFNNNDYIQFAGYPAVPTQPGYLNIYNRSNVYWFTYENTFEPVRYIEKNGYPETWTKTIQSSYETIHYEKDSLYERLGYAPQGAKDHWFWGSSSGNNGKPTEVFSERFLSMPKWNTDSMRITLRVGMHGLTNGPVSPDHNIKIQLTGQTLDSIKWDGQNSVVFEKNFLVGESVRIFNENFLQVIADGDIPRNPSDNSRVDVIRVNWFEITYVRYHQALGASFIFKNSPGLTGNNTYSIFNWTGNDMRIFIPADGSVINNPRFLNNQYQEILFADTSSSEREYFCVSSNSFMIPDSIRRSTSSDLRNSANGADYIIITHNKFLPAAERLAEYRSVNLSGYTQPRVKIVDVESIYNEFSNGLLSPYALQDFAKYAFENWTAPAPRYIVLMGDMSYDYRKLLKSSRENYIPSIPFQQSIYGEAVADNNIVTVAGDDMVPDMAIGRLSCETLDEAYLLVDKTINYPSDNGKRWKENILLIGGGQSKSDETNFGFNDHSLFLEKTYIKNLGYTTSKVFRYPNSPEHEPFQGDGPEIRKAFNEGCVIANFYGHGGGYQWDLIFLNDDIYLLENGGRLPFISSVTCYTAHFDNQDVFGEQFNKVPGKGSIAFWGSTGLTFWDPALSINRKLYEQLFTYSNRVIGDAILGAKVASSTNYALITEHVVLLSLLGDPALELALPKNPEFSIKPADISINPAYPVAEDSIELKLRIDNYGMVFLSDTLSITLTVTHDDTTEVIGQKFLTSFGQRDSVSFGYRPMKGGNYSFSFSVNENNRIFETDYSDNTASVNIYVYSLKEPNIVKPNNGMLLAADNAEIVISDIGHYIGKELTYQIQIDTSQSFTSPVVSDSLLSGTDGMLTFRFNVTEGTYYWRVRLLYESSYSNWTDTRTFRITGNPSQVYSFTGKQMNILELDNVIYSDELSSMVINTSFLPPKPSNAFWTGAVDVNLPPEIPSLSASTTDGAYIYYSSMAFFAGAVPIYKVGTGRMGTIKGQDYGAVPGVLVKLWHTMFFHNGFIYAATGDAAKLLKINPETGDTSSVNIPSGMLNENARVQNGAFFLNSDGRYVYNLATRDSLGESKYTLRIFDPMNNWDQVGPDKKLAGSSYANFVGFFAADGYIYPYENIVSGFMRRINIETGVYEEEWLTFVPFLKFRCWTFDWQNNYVYASTEGTTIPRFYEFLGRYKRSAGDIVMNNIGPSAEWKSLIYDIKKTNTRAGYNVRLYGKNRFNNNWILLGSNIPSGYSLSGINADIYPYLRAEIMLSDTSASELYPLRVNSFEISYNSLPELSVSDNYITFSPDSLLQGFPISLTGKVLNSGYTGSNVNINFTLNDEDTSFHQVTTFLPPDSTVDLTYEIPTSLLPPATMHKVTMSVYTDKQEFFTFNNLSKKNFYVSRDSINPVFRLTIDGKEIINGDIVSAKPEILITMKDNGPLPLRKEDFTIIYNNSRLLFDTTNIQYEYKPYPNSEASIKWSPQLKDGRHVLEVLAKDASGNFFDSTSAKVIFSVYNQFDIPYIYNYPNPFTGDTHFTFELRGDDKKLEEFRIRVYTIAGRLIREIDIDPVTVKAGFNKIYWDGRDQDGDELGNGVYLYKVITKNDGITKTLLQKMAKIK